MAMFGQLGSEFFKYRKSKTRSVDGSVPGVPYNRLRSHLTPPLGSGNRRASGYNHDLYMHGSPRDYRPNINAPSVDWDEYDTYSTPDFLHSPTSEPLLFRNLNNINDEKVFPAHASDDELYIDDVLRADTHLPVNIEELSPEELMQRFDGLTEALRRLHKTLPQNHPDVMNLKTALHDILSNDDAMSKMASLAPDTGPSKLGGCNPYEADMFGDAAMEYDRQIQQFEQIPEQFSQTARIEHQMISDILPDEQSVLGRGLEDIVAQEDSLENPALQFTEQDIIADEAAIGMDFMPESQDVSQIEQAIDQLKEEPLPQEIEPDPWQMQYDPFNPMAQMFAPDYMMPPGFGPMGPM